MLCEIIGYFRVTKNVAALAGGHVFLLWFKRSKFRKSYKICGVDSLNIIRFMEFGGFASKMVKERQSVFGAIFRQLDNGGLLVEMINS